MKSNTDIKLMECGALTLSGTPCRQKLRPGQERCWQHRGTTCSVCLACMGGQSTTRTLGCGHEFHTRCLDRWKSSCTGPDPTCPMCRVPFDVPTYRCRLIIEKVMADPPDRRVTNFETQNVMSIVEGFGVLRGLVWRLHSQQSIYLLVDTTYICICIYYRFRDCANLFHYLGTRYGDPTYSCVFPLN